MCKILKLATNHFLIIAACLGGLTACGGGGGGTAPASTQQSNSATSIAVEQAVLKPGDINCSNGGIEIKTGLDTNFNGVLDNNEISNVQNVCNGLDGSDGNTALVNVIDEPAGANCVAGGKLLQSGKDTDNNGVLDAGEITSSAYLCHGENGLAGSDGLAGNDGHNALISSSDEPAGNNCLLGGKRFDSGIDLNNDSTLQSGEINATTYLCSSSNGNTPVLQPLLRLDNEPVGSNCPYGGTKISAGLDGNNDSILNSSEISQVSYSCNSGNVLVSSTDEPAGVNCLYGGTRLDAGSDINANTLLDTAEISSTSYICDDALDNLVWSREVASAQIYNRTPGVLAISGSGGRAALAADDNGNALMTATGQGFVLISGLLKNLKKPTPFEADLSFFASPSNTSFARDMLFPAVAAASSPDGRHAIAAYAKLNYPDTDFSILLQRFDLTNLSSFAQPVESVDDGNKEIYPSLSGQTVTDLKVAVNNGNTTTVAWVENGTSADKQRRSGQELWVNTYKFSPFLGANWVGAQKLPTAAGVQIQNLLMNSTGSSMILYYDMSGSIRTSMSFRYSNFSLGGWIDPGAPTGFNPTSNRVLASNIDELGRVRILYYKNQQIYANYFDLNTQVWGSPQALFTAGSIPDFRPDDRTNIIVNRQGDIAANDVDGFVYYYDVNTGSVDKRFLPSAFPLTIDATGVTMFGLAGSSGLTVSSNEAIATVSYYPQSGWGGFHPVDYATIAGSGKPTEWFFDPYGNANAVGSAGSFRLLTTFESTSTIPDLLSAPKGWNYRVFVSNLP